MRPELGPCWLWTGAVGGNRGYGNFAVDGRRSSKRYARAHRFAYELLVGPISAWLVLDHLCRNHLCVNPAHLEPVTQAENLRRGERGCGGRPPQNHCKRGHALEGDNLYEAPGGGRRCRTCHNERMRGVPAGLPR